MSWYCLTVPPQRELAAVAALSDIGIETLCPVEHRPIRRHGATVSVRSYALMPGYLPANLGACPDWPLLRALEDARGNRLIRRALGCNGSPTPLPGLAVSAIRTLVLEPRVVPTARGLQVGDTAVLIDGPFSGHRAKVKRINRDRSLVAVAMTLFGSLREVECPIMSVERDAA